LPGGFVLLRLLFLFKRNFINSMTGSIAGAAPSGLIPGGGAGARSWSCLRCGGEDRGLDRFFTFLFRVLLVKIEALSLVICLARSLNTTLYLPFD
jgi:hypothetical protein